MNVFVSFLTYPLLSNKMFNHHEFRVYAFSGGFFAINFYCVILGRIHGVVFVKVCFVTKYVACFRKASMCC